MQLILKVAGFFA